MLFTFSLSVILHLFDDHPEFQPKFLFVKQYTNSPVIAKVPLENNTYSISLEPGKYVAHTYDTNFNFVFDVVEGDDNATLLPSTKCVVGRSDSDDTIIVLYNSMLPIFCQTFGGVCITEFDADNFTYQVNSLNGEFKSTKKIKY